jgi:hypothetical protein
MELSLENLTAYANGLTEYNRLTTFLSEIKHEDAISKKLALIARFLFLILKVQSEKTRLV